MIVGDSDNDEARISTARALRRRFEDAVPISQAEDKEEWIEESEWTIEGSISSPDSAPAESQGAQETLEEEAVTETTPEDVFDMREVEDALPQAEWPHMVGQWEITPEIGLRERAFNVLTQSLLTMGIHGIVNWMVGGRITAAVSSPGIISAFTAATLNNMPQRESQLERDMKVFLKATHEFIKLVNHTAEANGKAQDMPTIGNRFAREDVMSDDMTEELKRILRNIKSHMENITSILDDCVCDNLNDGWKTSRGEDTWIDRMFTWILGARDNMVTWAVGILWDIFGLPALRGAFITKNGWQLLGVMIILGKIMNLIGSAFACLWRKVRRIVSIVRGLWWTMRFVWFVLRRDWEGLKGLITTKKEGQPQQAPVAQPNPPPRQEPGAQPEQAAPQ